MAEIPVEKRSKGVPGWAWILGLGTIALVALFFLLTRGTHETAGYIDGTKEPTSGATLTSGNTCTDDNGCGERDLCLEGTCKAIDANTSVCSAATAHFATNSATLDPAAKGSLDRTARCLRADRKLTLTIEGNADQRGASPKNDALADQRAHTVATELAARGVSNEQLHVVSYGENRLLCGADDEACWSKNRRTDTQINK